MNKDWRSKDVINLFLKLYYVAKLKIKILIDYFEVSKSTLYRWIEKDKNKSLCKKNKKQKN